MHETSPHNARPRRLWSPVSLAVIFFLWLILQIGGLFNPGLLDDVDSIYIEIAREMLQRHDFVTPYIDGIRFFDKPPLCTGWRPAPCTFSASTTGPHAFL
ncbi:ArnT family glycosyltransferase [Tunturiibacter gelidiferens]|uniref:ArnT family glycosyltransferase n=1 Tax=Tunturiibacter gelidiferens TaxID=3069689 RepID=UPI003D9AEB44